MVEVSGIESGRPICRLLQHRLGRQTSLPPLGRRSCSAQEGSEEGARALRRARPSSITPPCASSISTGGKRRKPRRRQRGMVGGRACGTFLHPVHLPRRSRHCLPHGGRSTPRTGPITSCCCRPSPPSRTCPPSRRSGRPGR